MRYSFLILLGLSLFFACSKNGPEPETTSCTNPTSFTNPIIPNNLQVGQRNRYLLFRAWEYPATSAQNFEYLPDTLIVEVSEKNGQGFLFKEYFTCGSKRVESAPWLVIYADSAMTHQVSVVNDSLWFQPTLGTGHGPCCTDSRLTFQRTVKLPLKRVNNPETAIVGWGTTQPYAEKDRMAFIQSATLLNKNWPFLNAAILDGEMATDGPGFTCLYDGEYGIARCVYYSWWTQAGFGFDYLTQ